MIHHFECYSDFLTQAIYKNLTVRMESFHERKAKTHNATQHPGQSLEFSLFADLFILTFYLILGKFRCMYLLVLKHGVSQGLLGLA